PRRRLPVRADLARAAQLPRDEPTRVSANRERRADRHEPSQREDGRVAHPDAPVRDASGENLRLVGAMDADVAAARPVGQRGLMSTRARTRTSFCVPSVVPVGSFVTIRPARLGFTRTTADLITTAQRATLSFVSFVVSG